MSCSRSSLAKGGKSLELRWMELQFGSHVSFHLIKALRMNGWPSSVTTITTTGGIGSCFYEPVCNSWGLQVRFLAILYAFNVPGHVAKEIIIVLTESKSNIRVRYLIPLFLCSNR